MFRPVSDSSADIFMYTTSKKFHEVLESTTCIQHGSRLMNGVDCLPGYLKV
jgi:hypothetical protein